MARPITVGLILEGEDAKRFDEYMDNPNDITPEGRQILIEARTLAKILDLNKYSGEERG